MARILSVDYGDRKIGLALSDPLKIIAGPLDTLRVKSMEETVVSVASIIRENSAEAVVVGYPWNLKGEKSHQTKKVDKFIAALKEVCQCKIIPWDESFSSERAKAILIQKGIKTGHNKTKVDEMAARIILQEYLDSLP